FGDAGNDSLFGGNGDDIFNGGTGADAMFGGNGRDTVGYETASGGVAARLDTAQGSFGEALGDTYSGIEDLNGSAFDDFLVGDAINNIIRGGAGGDTIFGQGGRDVLFGGNGGDILNGGAGSDLFFYDATTDGGDVIQDFSAADINEALMFSGLLTGTFSYRGGFGFTASGNTEARFTDSNDFLEIDFNGDGFTDFALILQGVSAANLGADDFVFV
ncbi:MAG: calcium-binding protein, partial [Pseudomonadota bacterium]